MRFVLAPAARHRLRGSHLGRLQRGRERRCQRYNDADHKRQRRNLPGQRNLPRPAADIKLLHRQQNQLHRAFGKEAAQHDTSRRAEDSERHGLS